MVYGMPLCKIDHRCIMFVVLLNDTAPTEIYTYLHTLSLHYALPISYEQASARMFPLMAESTPKRRRLLRSGDRRKRKRGIRLYWAAPGEHSRGRILMEIDQGNFARSKFLIRGGPVSTTEWRKPFSSLGVEFLPGHGPVRNEAGETIGRASCMERVCK